MDWREMMESNRRAGFHWFSPDTMRFFRCRLLWTSLVQGSGGIYFVSSERGPSNVRRYTVRVFDPLNGTVGTVGAFNEVTRGVAMRQAKRCAADKCYADVATSERGAS